MKKILFQAFLIVFISSLIGMGVNIPLIRGFFQGEYDKGFNFNEKFSEITLITLPEAQDYFFTGNVVFVDSRPEEAFREGHIPGSINIPFEGEGAELNVELTIPVESLVVIYCDADDCQSSLFLAKMLQQLGYKNTKVFFGGWVEWVKEGMPRELSDDTE